VIIKHDPYSILFSLTPIFSFTTSAPTTTRNQPTNHRTN
jgi:hypothetical protein